MPVRRNSDPAWVQLIWDAVRFIVHQRQQTDMDRITRYLQRMWDHPAVQSEYHIRQLLLDNLLISENRTGQKGTKVGLITECFKVPPADNSTPEDDGHDWYCIECHLPGDVICCATCHRVFHLSCHSERNETKTNSDIETEKNITLETEIVTHTPVENNNTDTTEVISAGDVTSTAEQTVPTICSVCRLLQKENECIMKRDELNYLLNFTLTRIKIWLPPNITDTMAPRIPQPWINEQELRWRANQLLYQTMDIRIMEMKLRTKEYTKLAEFHADVITIQHNVAIFHGKDSQEMESSKLMLHDCVYDLVELAQCIDCYRHSNEKSSHSWFCIPCNSPHELVWAKQKGYTYWPAKVIKKTDLQYDVRFFGAKHLRSLVDKNYIKPIEITLQSLRIKRTQAFNKALQELHLHQKLLTNPDEVAKLLLNADIKAKQIEKRLSLTVNKTKKAKVPKLSTENDDVYEFQDSSLDIDIAAELSPNITSPKKVITPKNKIKTPKVPKKNKNSDNMSLSDEPLTRRSNGKDCDIIDISDGESKTLSPHFDSGYDFVSSSTEHIYSQPTLSVEKVTRTRNRRGSSGATQQLDRPYSDSVEKLRRQLEPITDREEMIKVSMDAMQQELDRTQNSQAEHLRSMIDAHNLHISEIKKKQWCYNCEQEAIYHCCWNTAYCSTICQQQHWQSEHKKVCRRKR